MRRTFPSGRFFSRRRPYRSARHGASTPVVETVFTSETYSGADTTDMTGRSTDALNGGTPQPWSVSSAAQVGILANEMYRSGATGFANVMLTPPGADYMIEAEITAAVNATSFLTARYVDNTNHYRVVQTGTTLQLAVIVASVVTNLGAVQAFTTGTYALKVSGSTVQLLINGVVVDSVTDTSFAAAGTTGFRLGAANSAGRVTAIRVVVPPFV